MYVRNLLCSSIALSARPRQGHDTADHATIIDLRHAARISGQTGFKPRQLLTRQPEEIRHSNALTNWGLQSDRR